MLIDAHHHLWYDLEEGGKTRRYFPQRQGWYICMRWAYTGLPPYNKDPKALYERQLLRMSDYDCRYAIASLDYWKMDGATLLPVDYDLNFGQTSDITWEEKHQHLGELQKKHPTRLYPFVNIDPRRLGSLELVKKAFEEYGKFYCLKLVPGVGFYPWDPMCYPLYEYCIDNDIPVAFCTEAHIWGYRRNRFSDPMYAMDVRAEFPDLKIILLHAGYQVLDWFQKSTTAANDVNTWMQLDSWITTRGSRPGMWDMRPGMFADEEALIKMMALAYTVSGPHKIMWGTDASHGPSYVAPTDGVDHQGWLSSARWLQSLPEKGAKYGFRFQKEHCDWMVGDNFARVFGLVKDPDWQIPNKFGWRYRIPSPGFQGR
ncbi:MAG: amidohydrolase family protein [Chloroflexi bacterium]|nr:amidohydrolase family protein [Chloroflexota bacterium]